MADRRQLGVQDALWLEMDRPNNRMVVDSVIWTAEPLDWSRVRQVIEDRLSTRYPVFRSLAVKDRDGSWWWELDDDFDFGARVACVCPEDVMGVGGTVDQGFDTVNVQGLFTVSLDELGATYEGVLPGLFG